MKLQIFRTDDEKIENYKHIQCYGTPLDLSDIADNECEEILAGDVLDMYSVEMMPQLIQQLVGKLRIGGRIVLGGTEFSVLAKHIINGGLTAEAVSQIIASKKSVTDVMTIKNALKQLGLNILSTSINGVHCEVTAKRG